MSAILHSRPAFRSEIIEALSQACTSVTTIEYSAKALLFPQGTLANSVFFVESGLLKLTHVDSEGKEIIVGLRRSGSLLGTTAALLDRPQPTGAVALTHCRLQRIPATEFRGFIDAQALLCRCLCEFQAREAHDHLLREVELACRTADFRLAKLLSDLSSEADSVQHTIRTNVRIPIKQWEIAELLALSPEHTNRLLRRLEEEGLVLRRDKHLFVPHPDKLLSYLNR